SIVLEAAHPLIERTSGEEGQMRLAREVVYCNFLPAVGTQRGGFGGDVSILLRRLDIHTELFTSRQRECHPHHLPVPLLLDRNLSANLGERRNLNIDILLAKALHASFQRIQRWRSGFLSQH